MESQNNEFRAVIKFLTKEGANTKKSISAWLILSTELFKRGLEDSLEDI